MKKTWKGKGNFTFNFPQCISLQSPASLNEIMTTIKSYCNKNKNIYFILLIDIFYWFI